MGGGDGFTGGFGSGVDGGEVGGVLGPAVEHSPPDCSVGLPAAVEEGGGVVEHVLVGEPPVCEVVAQSCQALF